MSDVTRRAVLGAGAGVAGLVALGLGEGDADAATTFHAVPLRSHYTPALGRVFTASRGGHSYRLRLTAIRDLKPTTAKQRSHSFTLVFTPVGNAHRPVDGIYAITSRATVAHHLFLRATR